MNQHTPSDFDTTPIGGEALPPKGSEYDRALHVPNGKLDPRPWMLIRGKGAETAVEWVDAEFLAASGFVPADSIATTLNMDDPEIGGPMSVQFRISFPVNRGVYAWAAATHISEIVGDANAVEELVANGDQSAIDLFRRAHPEAGV